MKFFVTGLCLQGNKGGPALALSLMKVLRKEIPAAEFTFSVPPEPEFRFEQKWAARYGVAVVEDDWEGGVKRLRPWQILKDGLSKGKQRFEKLGRWHRALRKADVVLDMTAISYVGPPEGTEHHALGMRYRHFQAARSAGRVFRAWTQSYGPFSTPAIQRAAKQDLSRLPCVYCRGQESMQRVRELIPDKECRSYPDVAVVLDYDRLRGMELIRKAFGKEPDRPVITFSPSSVQFSKAGAEGQTAYLEQRAHLAERLLDLGCAVLFVPHTLRPMNHVPWLCDQAVCFSIHSRIRPDPWVAVLLDDHSATDLKSIISCAAVHVGGRYHSVVAALSSGVPAISLSWHHKYGDIMDFYRQSRYVIDGGRADLAEVCGGMVGDLLAARESVCAQLRELQPDLEAAVQENAHHLVKGLSGCS